MTEPSANSLTDEEQALWHAIKMLGDEACQAVGRDITARTALSGADFAILSRLDELGDGRLAQRDLLASLGWDKSRVSHQLRRMEERGLVTRDQIEGAACATLTEAGAQALALTRPVHAAAIRERALQHVRPEERDALIAVARRIAAAVKK
ncbi:MarR family transcriptional regulator [Martelella alba]|uniref:MarR family transcriptional regulator n=1 Tax=Martelella alba TaxID=2590451 RepID=A0A506UEJ5_9HYPH|nr:MarR family transcriptional regulator [Martelella alba]TPW31394.1 MarR family transcriptional regulator [Martelella alba]